MKLEGEWDKLCTKSIFQTVFYKIYWKSKKKIKWNLARPKLFDIVSVLILNHQCKIFSYGEDTGHKNVSLSNVETPIFYNFLRPRFLNREATRMQRFYWGFSFYLSQVKHVLKPFTVTKHYEEDHRSVFSTQLFPVHFCKIILNSYSVEHFWTFISLYFSSFKAVVALKLIPYGSFKNLPWIILSFVFHFGSHRWSGNIASIDFIRRSNYIFYFLKIYFKQYWLVLNIIAV